MRVNTASDVLFTQFFDFHTAKLEQTMILPSPAVSILLHRDSGLLAVICDDMVVRVIDIDLSRIVRELGGFQGRILDIVCSTIFLYANSKTCALQTFSPDSRWLVVTSLDSIIRTFDLPTGRLIDAFRTSSVATSVTFSPTNDFLATAHVDSVGVYLWWIFMRRTLDFSDVTSGPIEHNMMRYHSRQSLTMTFPMPNFLQCKA